jgi:hypothetical protein
MTRTLPRALATAGVAALLVAGLAMPAGAAAGTTVYVVPADLSGTNFSAALNKWDAANGAAAATLPAAGTKWILDTEMKPVGEWSITSDGLVFAVDAPPNVVPRPTTPPAEKVRFQYYVGSGGYPTIDSQHPTLNTLLASPITWDLELQSGDRTTYGPVFQVQLQRLLPDGVTYARVTVQTVWDPADGTHDLQNGLWFANTNICTGGYADTTTSYGTCAGTVANGAGSGPGVSAAVLAQSFGKFDVVSFGPNLGRDYAYSFSFQNVTALGHTFKFVTQLPAAPVVPPVSGGTSTPPVTTSTRSSSELPTFSVPTATPTPTPSPSQSDEPETPADEGDEADGDEVVVADPPKDAGGFPVWIVFLGVGFLVLLLAFLFWLLRRRAV